VRWEIAKSEYTEERGLSTGAVTNNDEFPVGSSVSRAPEMPLVSLSLLPTLRNVSMPA